MDRRRAKWIAVWGLTGLLLGGLSVRADQQLWASQYVQWKFDGGPQDIWNVDQEVWIAQPNVTSFWPLQWDFKGLNYGGYIGLQQGTGAEQNVRFSIWNATEAKGNSCRKFDGEGVGQTCTLTLRIDPRKFYRLRIWRLKADSTGQWWGGWLIETDAAGNLSERSIGQIKAPPAAKSVNPASTSNFVEYWGDPVRACRAIPLSIVSFTPPSVNHRDNAGYESTAQFAGSKMAEGNHCSTGGENTGALITVQPAPGSNGGVTVFLGGVSAQHVLSPTADPTPPRMPARDRLVRSDNEPKKPGC